MATVTADRDALVEEIVIKAPPERIFRALTEPRELLAWWGDEAHYRCTSWTLDLRVGGVWRSVGRNAAGKDFVVEGEFLEVAPPHRLAYSWRPSWVNAAGTTVRIALDPVPGGTRLTWTHSGFARFPEALEDHRGGLPTVIAWLKGFVEGTRADLADASARMS